MKIADTSLNARLAEKRSELSAADTLPLYQSRTTTDAENMRLRLIRLSDDLSMSISTDGTACLYDSHQLDKLESLETSKEQMALLDRATVVDLDAEEVHAIAQLLSLHVIFQLITDDEEEDDDDDNSTVH